MCYDTAQLAYRIYREALRLNVSPDEIAHLKQKWEKLKEDGVNYYHASGYAHPKLAAFTRKEEKIDLNLYRWGLIPHWVKDEEQARQIWNNTINARGETLFEKPSFRDAAKMGRCIIPLNGFYEHHHKGGKTFPYFIQRKDRERLLVGGLTANWVNKETGEIFDTLSLVTTNANELMAQIHNNPKVKEPRMPLILDEEDAETWLEGSQEDAMQLIKPNNSQILDAWTVPRLRGKDCIGNKKEIQKKFEYE